MEEKKGTRIMGKSIITKNQQGYGYCYTDLAQINKLCEESGIRYYQEIETCEINGKDYIITYLVYPDSIERHRGCQIVDAVLSGIKNPVQEYGSSLTYCRRYSLLMALGLATEDDDASSLTQEPTKEEALSFTFSSGKHTGKRLNEVPRSYLEWTLENVNNPRLHKLIYLATGIERLTEDEKKEKFNLTKEIQELVFDKNIDLEDIKDNYNVNSLSELTLAQARKLYGELNG